MHLPLYTQYKRKSFTISMNLCVLLTNGIFFLTKPRYSLTKKLTDIFERFHNFIQTLFQWFGNEHTNYRIYF